MLIAKPLPPTFLLPAWSTAQLQQLIRSSACSCTAAGFERRFSVNSKVTNDTSEHLSSDTQTQRIVRRLVQNIPILRRIRTGEDGAQERLLGKPQKSSVKLADKKHPTRHTAILAGDTHNESHVNSKDRFITKTAHKPWANGKDTTTIEAQSKISGPPLQVGFSDALPQDGNALPVHDGTVFGQSLVEISTEGELVGRKSRLRDKRRTGKVSTISEETGQFRGNTITACGSGNTEQWRWKTLQSGQRSSNIHAQHTTTETNTLENDAELKLVQVVPFQRKSAWNSVNGLERRENFVQRESIDSPLVLSKQEPPGPSPPSLLEELFPEVARKLCLQPRILNPSAAAPIETPRLQPPDLTLLEPDYPIDVRQQKDAVARSKDAAAQALRRDRLTVLMVTAASLSLVDADFRRIVPRGRHIEEWRGPGDILTVVPGRNRDTLERKPYYFLIFPNATYARVYQDKVKHLHNLTSTHTPSSLESPMALPPGMLVDGEDVGALIADYTLAAPSQFLRINALLPPYTPPIDNVIQGQGYPNLGSRAGRSVLFWVNGFQPSDQSLTAFLHKDGQDRGIAWGAVDGRGTIQRLEKEQKVHAGHSGEETHNGDANIAQPGFSRWVLEFEDESEARRFVRTWHRRPYIFPLRHEWLDNGEPTPCIHAEFLW